MAYLDWSQCSIVEGIPGKASGVWVLRGTRTPVKVIFENLEAGMSIEEVIEQFLVTREQLDGLMAFVARSLDKAPNYASQADPYWNRTRCRGNEGEKGRHRLSLDPPLIRPAGRCIALTNEQVYDLISVP